MPNDRQLHSPTQIENSSSPSPTQPANTAHVAHSTKMNGAPNTPNSDEVTPNDRFTLMHPAFQHVHHKRKFCNDKTMNQNKGDMNRDDQHTFFTNAMDKKSESAGHRLHPHDEYFQRAMKMNSIQDNDDLSGDSSGSEEIDPTSNGCIDFSNNNNNSGKANL